MAENPIEGREYLLRPRDAESDDEVYRVVVTHFPWGHPGAQGKHRWMLIKSVDGSGYDGALTVKQFHQQLVGTPEE